MKRLATQLSLAMIALVLFTVCTMTVVNIVVLQQRVAAFFPAEFWRQVDALDAQYPPNSNTDADYYRAFAGLLAAQISVFQQQGVNIEPILQAITGYDLAAPVMSALITALIGLLLALALSRQIAKPVSRVAGAVRALAQGDLGVRAEARTPWVSAEVTGLAQDFNAMAGLLERSEAERRALIADVAHELRTPLSVLQGHLDAMIDGYLAPSEANLALLAGRTETLSRLIQDLRTLSLSDAGRLMLDMHELDLVALAEKTVRGWRLDAEKSGATLTFSTTLETAPVRGDAQRLAQVLDNLLSNALRFTPPGGSVHVMLERADAYHLSVQDTGPGIPDEDISRVFTRFYKTGAGSGLGLSVAQSLAQLHGGRLSVCNTPHSGAKFTLSVPILAPSPLHALPS